MERGAARLALRFVVVPGHQIPDVERVVETTPAYNVIEKFGEAAEIARERDPRRPSD